MKTKEERKKVMLLVLPVVFLPLLALVFFTLGGGSTDGAKAGEVGKGLNAELPGAKFGKDKQPDKFSLYEQAGQDSIRKAKGPGAFAALGFDTAGYRRGAAQRGKDDRAVGGLVSVGLGGGSAKESEAKIREKLAEIDKAVHAPPVSVKPDAASGYGGHGSDNFGLMRLEKMLRAQEMDEGKGPDPELERLNGMLDKIVAIQHPGGVAGKDSLGRKGVAVRPDTAFKAVPAVVDGNQKVLQGGLVRLRLSDTLRCRGVCFPKGQLLFGSCTVSNQRLFLEIRNIRLGTAIVPVNLTVFSLDGLPGIDAPEAELGEAAGQGTANALGNIQFLGMDQSVATQAAAAGISAAKGLIGRKATRVKVHLKGGYPVLLRNNQAGGK